MDSCAQKDTY